MTISKRQILLFLALVSPIGKMIVLPARAAELAKNDLLLPVLFQILLQTVGVFCALLVCKREKPLYELLSNRVGAVFAKGICILLSLFLLFAALIPLFEQKLFVQSVFYDTLPSIVAFAPFFVFSAYLCAKPLSSYGRVWDVLAVVFAVGYTGIALLSAGSTDFGALLPVGASGKAMLQTTAKCFHWFFDGALLLPLAGKIKYEKGLAWKGAVCYLTGGVLVLAFLALFYGIFQETAPNQLFAFSATAKYFPGVTMLGRVDYIFIFALALAAAFYVILPVQGAVECTVQAFGRNRLLPALLSVGANLVFLILVLVLDYRFGDLLDALSAAGKYVFPLFTLLLPASLLLGRNDRA